MVSRNWSTNVLKLPGNMARQISNQFDYRARRHWQHLIFPQTQAYLLKASRCERLNKQRPDRRDKRMQTQDLSCAPKNTSYLLDEAYLSPGNGTEVFEVIASTRCKKRRETERPR